MNKVDKAKLTKGERNAMRKRKILWGKMIHKLCIERAEYRCEICGGWDNSLHKDHINGFGLTGHHIKGVCDNGSDITENVLILCSNCHDKIHEQGGYGKRREK